MIPVTDYIKRNVYVRKVQSSLASQKFLQAFKDLNLDESNLCLFHVLIKYPQWEKDVDLFQFIRKKNVKQLRKDPKTFFLFDASTEGFSTIYGNTPFYDVLYHNCRVHNISPKKVILITSNMVENKNLIRYNTYHSIKESIHVASFHNFEHMLFNLKVDTLPVSGLAEAELDTRIEKVYLNAVKNRKRYYYGEKHFLSLSRVNRPHRTLSAFEIFNSNLYQNCILSHDRIKKPEHYCQETELIRGSKGKLSFRALKKFNRHLPLIADTNDFKTNHAMYLNANLHHSTLFQVVGETFTFKYYSFADDAIYDVSESLEWVTDIVAGNLLNPFVLTVSTSTDISVDLSAGWNWISVNATQDDMGINSAFSTLSAEADDYIKSQTTAATFYDGYGWYPGFDIGVESMYLLKLADAGIMNYQGTPADPSLTPIGLASGWNWIGYVPQGSMGVSTALGNATLVANDYIKSQTTAATYYDGYGFYPSFDMNPTGGYMLKVENGGSFTYPSGGALFSAFNNMLIEEDLYYKKYEFNGSVSASINIEDVAINRGDILYAYSNGELRGKTSPSIFPLTDKFVFTLMVYGHGLDDEKVNFELYNQVSDKTYKIKERIQFEKDMIVGNAYNTFELKVGEYSNHIAV